MLRAVPQRNRLKARYVYAAPIVGCEPKRWVGSEMEVGLGGLWAAAWVAGETDREGNLFQRELARSGPHFAERAAPDGLQERRAGMGGSGRDGGSFSAGRGLARLGGIG